MRQWMVAQVAGQQSPTIMIQIRFYDHEGKTVRKYPLQVKPSDTVKQTKLLIEQLSQLSIENAQLIENGSGKNMRDSKQLQDYNIVNGSIIHINFLKCRPLEAVREDQRREAQREARQEAQRARREAQREAQRAIQDPIRINIKYIKYNNQIIQTIPLDVKPSHTVMDIKLMLQEITGVFAVSQDIYFAGRRLDDEKTLQHYNIRNNSSIFMTIRMR